MISPSALREAAVAQLKASETVARWTSPNAGMRGGEIRIIGDAATPTYTAQQGPSPERYIEGARRHAESARSIFGDEHTPRAIAADLLSRLFGGRPAAPPPLTKDLTYAPFSVRALDPGQAIYTHHDNHFGLPVYRDLDPELDRSTALSWFVTLEAPEGGGKMVIYGLWGSDPNPPMLPTRFMDTAAIEARFARHECELRSGDLIVFNAGDFVHRVTPVEGSTSRLTMGGFFTIDRARTRLAFWS